jgi:hypothetical protein
VLLELRCLPYNSMSAKEGRRWSRPSCPRRGGEGDGRRRAVGLLRSSPTEEGSDRFTTSWSSSMKREVDDMLTCGDEFDGKDGGGTIHQGWGKLEIC